VSPSAYIPTDQQNDVIAHTGPAFVRACPGAGKTRTLVERAGRLLGNTADGRGVAFLSFTNAAVDELANRLRAFGVLPHPLFPSFIGTFDRFLWQFFIVPFGIPGYTGVPRLVPDKSEWEVRPFENAQPLPLRCFYRGTGKVDASLANREGFDVANRSVTPYETRALNILNSARSAGQIDFEDVRVCVRDRLRDATFASRLGAALSARFREIVVDEAQDCNPADLSIVNWLRQCGVTVKVICDPHQSIYQFRGGVTDELLKFADTFDTKDRLSMSGNFRSTPAICAAIVALRPPEARSAPDEPLGDNKADPTPVHILSYSGSGVSPGIGPKFSALVRELNIPLHRAPVLASRLASASRAIGQPTLAATTHPTLLLAQAAMNYHFAFAVGSRRDALVALHRVVLLVREQITTAGAYHTFIASNELANGRWRPGIIEIANGLQFEPSDDPNGWLQRARALLAPGCVGTSTINQRLRSHVDLQKALVRSPADSHPTRTIHSAKGMEFPAVCVVLTSQRVVGILSHLEGTGGAGAEEDARKIYVAASRAERLLALAVPRSRASRLAALLASTGCTTAQHQI